MIAARLGRIQECAVDTGEKRGLSESDAALYERLRRVGTVILAAGLPAAALVALTAAPVDEGVAADSKRYEYEMELVGGKSNVFAAEVNGWIAGLWHGRGLAHLLAFVAVAGSFMCFFLAHRLKHHGPRAAPVGRNP
jgi:hypothetical protein